MSKTTIEQSVRDSLQTYFQDLEGEMPDRVYEMVVRMVERPMLRGGQVVGQRAPSRRDLAMRVMVTASDWLPPRT